MADYEDYEDYENYEDDNKYESYSDNDEEYEQEKPDKRGILLNQIVIYIEKLNEPALERLVKYLKRVSK